MTWWEPFYVFSNEIAHLRMSKQRFENAVSASQICLKCDSSPIASYCTSLEIPPFLYFVSCFFQIDPMIMMISSVSFILV